MCSSCPTVLQKLQNNYFQFYVYFCNKWWLFVTCFPPIWQIMHYREGIALGPTCASCLNIINPPLERWFVNAGKFSLSWPWLLHFTHDIFSRASGWTILSCFRLSISRHKFFNCAWIYWTPKLGSYIGVSCSLIVIYKSFAWVVNLYGNKMFLKCSVSDATNHS